jgi:Domain of Unknown Function (DUF1080)
VTLLVLVLASAGAVPAERPPEFGYGLNADDARAGWISLFDGQTSFGWTNATVRDGVLAGGTSTGPFGECDVHADDAVPLQAGNPIQLGPGTRLRHLRVLPKLSPLPITSHNQTWKVVAHPTLPRDRQATWEPLKRDGQVFGFRAVGGPGCVELPGLYGDFVLQIDVNCRKPLSNAGVFFRSRPGDFLNGYEAQVFNACRDGDPAKPARWCTGAIDDRQNARRLVSRDGQPFTMTIVAAGPHIATWVNGVQVTDWTDTRPPYDNPRQGLRLEPGTIQLQAHDKATDVEFSNIRIAPLK